MADSPVQKRGWSLKKKLLVYAGLPLLVLLGVALVLDGFALGSLNGAMREARAVGGPVTFAEIEAARKAWPDERNGALVLTGLQTQLDAALHTGKTIETLPSFSDQPPTPLGRKLAPEKLQAAQAELKRLVPELAVIDRLLQFEGGRFPAPAAPNPMANMLPDLRYLRSSAKLKTDQALCRVMGGDASRLVDDVAVIARHGRLLADEPLFISALMRIALESLVVHTMEAALGLTTLTPEQLEQLDAIAAGMEGRDRLSWAIRGERAFFIAETESLRKRGTSGVGGGGAVVMPWGIGRIPGLRGFLMHDQATGLRLYNRLVAALGDPRKAAEVAGKLDREVADMRYIYNPLTRSLMPSLVRSFELDKRLEACIRAARAGLAAERYRLDAGRFPPSLAALVPRYMKAVPTDPFDDQPLRYRADEQGAVVYTIGDDLQDDGGKVSGRVIKRADVRDYGFALLPPDRRGAPATQPASAPTSAPAPEEEQ